VNVKKRSELRQVTIVTEFCTEVPFRMPRPFPKSSKDYTAAKNRGVEVSPSILRKTWSNAKQLHDQNDQIQCGRAPYGGSGLRNPQGSLGYGRAGFLFFLKMLAFLKMLVQNPYPVELLVALGRPLSGFW
jgi:hypothetical protein